MKNQYKIYILFTFFVSCTQFAMMPNKEMHKGDDAGPKVAAHVPLFGLPNDLSSPNVAKDGEAALYDSLLDEVKKSLPGEQQEVVNGVADQLRPTRFLVVGQPGVGKTTFAKACAHMGKRPAVFIHAGALCDQYQFSGDANLRKALLDCVNRGEPCTIIIDEVDNLTRYQHDPEKPEGNALVVLREFIDTHFDNPNFSIICTTNRPDQLPDDFKSRFDRVEMPLPAVDARVQMVEYHLKVSSGVYTEEDCFGYVDAFAKKCEGLSARDIQRVVANARCRARSRDAHNAVIKRTDLEASLAGVRKQIQSDQPSLMSRAWKNFNLNTVCGVLNTGMSAFNVYAYIKNTKLQEKHDQQVNQLQGQLSAKDKIIENQQEIIKCLQARSFWSYAQDTGKKAVDTFVATVTNFCVTKALFGLAA